MVAIKTGFSLLPVSRIEQHFDQPTLRRIALEEFRRLEDAMMALAQAEHPEGLTEDQSRRLVQELLEVHHARWGRRPNGFHDQILSRLPTFDDAELV